MEFNCHSQIKKSSIKNRQDEDFQPLDISVHRFLVTWSITSQWRIKIESIDTIQYYFVINATSMDTGEKIIVLSSRDLQGNEIQIGQTYTLSLDAIGSIKNGPKKEDQVILSLRNLKIGDVLVRSHESLPFQSKNLRGLNYFSE